MEIFNIDSFSFTYIIIPLLIFLSRVTDVSIGTLRLIFLSKGFKVIAPTLGFFEVIIWLLAVTQIIKHVDNFVSYVAYGAGFAMGNYIGMLLEEKLSLGKVLIRIIPKLETSKLIEYMKSEGFGLTVHDAHGSLGPVKVILSIIDRKDLKELIPMINHYNPHAFYSIEDIRAVQKGVFPAHERPKLFGIGSGVRKSK